MNDETRSTVDTFEHAKTLALLEAKKHNNWSSAEVVLLIGTQRGPVAPMDAMCVTVRVYSHDEREPTRLSRSIHFPFRSITSQSG